MTPPGRRLVTLAATLVLASFAQMRPAMAAGELICGTVQISPVQTLSLSVCGTLDWALWQSATPENISHQGFDVAPVKLHKQGPSLISDLSFVGLRDPATAQEYWASAESLTTYTWTDGVSGAGASAFGVVIGAEAGFGVSFSVPANQDFREADIYYECRGSSATFTVQTTMTYPVKPACMGSVTGVQHFRISWWDPDSPLVVTLTSGSGPSGTGPALFGVTLNEEIFPLGSLPALDAGCDATAVGGAGGKGGGGAGGRGTGGGGAGGAAGAGAGAGAAATGGRGGSAGRGAGGVAGAGTSGAGAGGARGGGARGGGGAVGTGLGGMGGADGASLAGAGGTVGSRGGGSQGGAGPGNGLGGHRGDGFPDGGTADARGGDSPAGALSKGEALACAVSARASRGLEGWFFVLAAALLPWLRRRRKRSRTR